MPQAAGNFSCLTTLAGHEFGSVWVLVAFFIEDAEVGVVFEGVELALLRGMSFCIVLVFFLHDTNCTLLIDLLHDGHSLRCTHGATRR